MKKVTKKQFINSISKSVERMIVMNQVSCDMLNTPVEVVVEQPTTNVDSTFDFKPLFWTVDESTFNFTPINTQIEQPAPKEGKAQIARRIYDEMTSNGSNVKRSDILTRFMREANLTKDGAATYLQNIKKSKGLVNPK